MSESASRTRYCANCLTTFLGNPEICGNGECSAKRPGTHWGKLLEPGERIDGRFRIDRRLRIAAAGPTYLCQETDAAEQAVGDLLVLQVISPEAAENPAYCERLNDEIHTLHELEHPNLVRIRPLDPPDNGPPYLVMDYEAGGSLMDQLRETGAMNITHIAQLGLQLCDGLRAAHRESLIHGDLQPHRVLLDHIPESGEPPLVRITDFGALKTQGGMSQGLDPEGCAPQYAAPERMAGGPPSVEADIYAIGSLLLFSVSLQPLVASAERMHVDALCERLKSALPPRWSPPPGLNVDASQVAFFNAILNATMAADPADRSNLDEVREYLEALLEVEDEELFTTPEIEEAPEAEFNAEEAMAHFSAFSHDPDQTEEGEEEPEEEPVEEVQKPQAKKENEDAPAEAESPKPQTRPKPPRDWLKGDWLKGDWLKGDWLKRDWLQILWRAGQVCTGVAVVMMMLFVWIWNAKPHHLPPAWLEANGPPALSLVAGDHKTLPDYTSIVDSLNSKKGRLLKCGLGQDGLSVMVVVETNGRVRAAGASYLPKKQRICVRRKLLGMVLKRRSRVSPLRLRTTLLF
jgi:serine/threonine protein kinase